MKKHFILLLSLTLLIGCMSESNPEEVVHGTVEENIQGPADEVVGREALSDVTVFVFEPSTFEEITRSVGDNRFEIGEKDLERAERIRTDENGYYETDEEKVVLCVKQLFGEELHCFRDVKNEVDLRYTYQTQGWATNTLAERIVVDIV